MTLKPKQLELISYIDQTANKTIENGGDEIDIVIALIDKMAEIKRHIIEAPNKQAIEKYSNSHNGFRLYIKVIEDITETITKGVY